MFGFFNIVLRGVEIQVIVKWKRIFFFQGKKKVSTFLKQNISEPL